MEDEPIKAQDKQKNEPESPNEADTPDIKPEEGMEDPKSPEDGDVTRGTGEECPDGDKESSTDIYKAIVESLLFASSKPVPLRKLVEVINDSSGEKVDSKLIRGVIEQLRSEYDEQGRAFQIEEIADGFQALTRPEYHEWVRALASSHQQPRLSPAAVETLAIVAYKQPVNRALVDDIRGVQSGALLRTLMEKRLIKVVGREEVPGRPLLYGTTKEFLEHFGLKTIKDLPSVKELPDLS